MKEYLQLLEMPCFQAFFGIQLYTFDINIITLDRLLAIYLKILKSLISWTFDKFLSNYLLTFLRQYRTKVVVQMHSQIFRQIVPKFRRHTCICQEILVQYDGKYASSCAAKASAALCAVLP